MAHPAYGTTRKIPSLFERLQSKVEVSKTSKLTSKTNLSSSLQATYDSTDRLELLKNTVLVQIALLDFCNAHKINIDRALENYLK